MGFRKPMDYNSVHHQIYIAGVELHSPYNDGFTTFEIKKDLHKLKWLLDAIMNDSPTFTGEDEFLKEHEQTKMWRTLSK
jgi:vancomycin permeability regulator SanA